MPEQFNVAFQEALERPTPDLFWAFDIELASETLYLSERGHEYLGTTYLPTVRSAGDVVSDADRDARRFANSTRILVLDNGLGGIPDAAGPTVRRFSDVRDELVPSATIIAYLCAVDADDAIHREAIWEGSPTGSITRTLGAVSLEVAGLASRYLIGKKLLHTLSEEDHPAMRAGDTGRGLPLVFGSLKRFPGVVTVENFTSRPEAGEFNQGTAQIASVEATPDAENETYTLTMAAAETQEQTTSDSWHRIGGPSATAPSHDATTWKAAATGTSHSWTHTTAAGVTTDGVAIVYVTQSEWHVSGITWGGTAMVRSNLGGIIFYVLYNPPSGSPSVVMTSSYSPASLSAFSITLRNAGVLRGTAADESNGAYYDGTGSTFRDVGVHDETHPQGLHLGYMYAVPDYAAPGATAPSISVTVGTATASRSVGDAREVVAVRGGAASGLSGPTVRVTPNGSSTPKQASYYWVCLLILPRQKIAAQSFQTSGAQESTGVTLHARIRSGGSTRSLAVGLSPAGVAGAPASSYTATRGVTMTISGTTGADYMQGWASTPLAASTVYWLTFVPWHNPAIHGSSPWTWSDGDIEVAYKASSNPYANGKMQNAEGPAYATSNPRASWLSGFDTSDVRFAASFNSLAFSVKDSNLDAHGSGTAGVDWTSTDGYQSILGASWEGSPSGGDTFSWTTLVQPSEVTICESPEDTPIQSISGLLLDGAEPAATADDLDGIGTGGDASPLVGNNAAAQRRAQSFTPSEDDFLVELHFEGVRKVGAPTFTLNLDLYTDSSGNPGTKLATLASILASSLTTSYVATTLATAVRGVTGGTKYHLVLHPSAQGDASNYVEFQGHNSSGQELSGETLKNYNGSTWSTASAIGLSVRFTFHGVQYETSVDRGDGVWVARATLPQSLVDVSQATVSVEGLTDDASGSYTSAPGAVIRSPASAVDWLLRERQGCPAENVDTLGSFAATRTSHGSLYRLNGAFSDPGVDVMAAVLRIAAESRASFTWGGRVARFVYLDASVPVPDAADVLAPVDFTVPAADVAISRVDPSNVVNTIDLRYRRDYTGTGAGSYGSVHRPTPNAASVAAYGSRDAPEHYQFDFVRDPAMAADLAAFELATRAAPPERIAGLRVGVGHIYRTEDDIVGIDLTIDGAALEGIDDTRAWRIERRTTIAGVARGRPTIIGVAFDLVEVPTS